MIEENKNKSARIWELDFIRGIAIIGVIFIHTVFDMNYIFNVSESDILVGNPVYDGVQSYGSLIFIILSGICVTLGSKNLKRGITVFGGGVLISLATYIMIVSGMLSRANKIDFGILSCLGLCMICYTPFRKVNRYAVFVCGLAFIALGFYLESQDAPNSYFVFLGLKPDTYQAGDYFPFLKNFGYYLVGSFIGRTLYKAKKTLMPFFSDKTPVINIFCFAGRNTLIIYILHQPVVFGILYLLFPMR